MLDDYLDWRPHLEVEKQDNTMNNSLFTFKNHWITKSNSIPEWQITMGKQ